MLMRSVVKIFRRGSVSVAGLRGTGKDMLTANVIIRRRQPYVSNVDYGGQYYPYDYSALDLHVSCGDLITHNVSPYRYPYPDGTDIYLSDCGVYFPAHANADLNKQFGSLPTFAALSRHLGDCSIHFNSQSPARVWDKLREQSDLYILCRWCRVFFRGRLVVQKITLYDQYDAFSRAVPPFPTVLIPRLGKSREILATQRRSYLIDHGHVKHHYLIYRNKSTYDTRFFRSLFAGAGAGTDGGDVVC